MHEYEVTSIGLLGTDSEVTCALWSGTIAHAMVWGGQPDHPASRNRAAVPTRNGSTPRVQVRLSDNHTGDVQVYALLPYVAPGA